jgi:hypothetical protein
VIARLALLGAVAVGLGCYAARADGPGPTKYELNDEYRLETSFDPETSVATVTLFYRDKLSSSVSIGWANIAYDSVAFAKMCADCEPVLFVPAYDLSSTYGATTGIIAWQRNDDWSLSILPLSRPFLEDEDGDGIFALMDSLPTKPEPTEELYDFREGLISRLP